MSNVKMPEPVAVVVSDYALFWAGSGPIAPLCERTGAKVGSQLITTTQAEAYKDACVRKALEAVIQSLGRESDKARHFQAYAAVLALMSQAELIRASLSAKESKNG